jgi:apolipoprotein N-acyltransferase
MMSLKIRVLTFTVELLLRYQAHLETQQWLKQQRQQSWRVEGINAHIAKDIGADPDGRFRAKLQQAEPATKVNDLKQQTSHKAWRARQQTVKINT